MQTCGHCGQPRTEGKKFCTKCGTRFPDNETQPRSEPPQPVLGSSRYLTIAVGAACVLALAGIGTGAWFLVGHARAHVSPGSAVTPSASAVSTSQGLDTPTDSATPSPSASPTPSGPVTVASEAASAAQAQSVADFLDQYFDAINKHDYQAYISLLGPGVPKPTPSDFEKGYGTTTDSGETLTAIQSASNGDFIAEVKFASQQSPSESPNNSACDNWDIYLYLTPDDSGSYAIDQPQSGYHASYTAC
jgi:hypothetical protein